MPTTSALRRAALLVLSCSALFPGAWAVSATLRVQIQVTEVCETVSLVGGLTLRCTAGMTPPSDPRLLPELGREVRALGPLTLLNLRPEPATGGMLLHYGPRPAAAAVTLPDHDLIVFD